MWRDIALTNREAILEAMDAVASSMSGFGA